MLYTVLLCLFGLNLTFASDKSMSNYVNISELVSAYKKVDKLFFSLPNGSFYTYYLIDGEVKALSYADLKNRNHFSYILPQFEAIPVKYDSNHSDHVTTSILEDKKRGIIKKQVAKAFDSEFILSQSGRLKKYKCLDNEIFFFQHEDYTSKVVCARGEVELRTKMIITPYILGELDSYVLKDLRGKIILVVSNNEPLFPILDTEGSLRKVIRPSTKKVVGSIKYNKFGHVVESTGGFYIPYCFKGMYQEKFSEIYFDVDSYYDPDMQKFLVLSNDDD